MRYIIITTLFCLLFFYSYAQEILSGKYIQPVTEGLILEFHGQRFKAILGSSSGEGYYIKDKEKLILIYDEPLDKDSSTYTIETDQEKSARPKGISVEIFESDNKPMTNASIVMKDSNDNLIADFAADKKVNFFIWKGDLIEAICICSIGFKCIDIPVKKLGKSSKIRAWLKPVSGGYLKGKTVFSIRSYTKDMIVLKSPDEALEIMLKKNR
jgi:hypothetical protein